MTNANIVSLAQAEVDANYEYFHPLIPELEKAHRGKFALLHKQEIIDFFDSENDAIKAGTIKYGEGCFSVQQVLDVAVDLGFQSYAIL